MNRLAFGNMRHAEDSAYLDNNTLARVGAYNTPEDRPCLGRQSARQILITLIQAEKLQTVIHDSSVTPLRGIKYSPSGRGN